MADVTLGVAASGFAVASLAIQLIEVVQGMHTFWHSIKNSASEVEYIRDHLAILRSVLSAILENCEGQPQVSCGEAVVKSLEVCKSRMGKLVKLMPQRDADKHWSALRVTVRRKTIQDIESHLRGDVMLLLLTLQPFFQ
jgi:hypothetical protein